MLDINQLREIHISGFRSIKDCKLPLRNINVLIGSNGAGKSNFISAFSLLQSVLSKELQLYAARAGTNSLFYNGRKETSEIAFEVFFGNNSYGFVLIPTDDNRLAFEWEFFGYHGSFNNRSTVARGHTESMWETGTGNQISPYVQEALAPQNWRVYHFHDTSRSARIKQEHSIANDAALSKDAANLAAFLYRLHRNHGESYRKIVQTVRLIAPYFDDFVLSPQEENPEQILLKWRQKGCDDIFFASQLSDGTLRFICLTTLLLQPRELQPATLIVDEPELGLHPYAITIFAEMVKQIADNRQVILSTQSVELLSEFDVEDVVVVKRGNNGSEFERLDREALQQWLDADYALGDLWKKNILGGRLSK